RQIPDALESLGTNARGLVDRGSSLPWDQGALDRTPTAGRTVGSVSMPYRPIEDDDRSRRTTREYLSLVGIGRIRQQLATLAGQQMRTRNETSGAVLCIELVHHEDETNQRPPVGFTLDVHMKQLRRRTGFQRPGEHRAQLERSIDDPTTGRQHWTVDVESVEL